ncbi:Small ribosomal subunit protein uS9m-like protein [Drosera capensis]
MGVAEGDTEGEWKDGDSSWDFRSGDGADVNVFDGVDTKFEKSGNPGGRGSDEWLTADGYKPWSFDEEENVPNVLDIGEVERVKEIDDVIKVADEERKKAEKKALENEEKALTAVLKFNVDYILDNLEVWVLVGPDRAFGDLVAASGISDAMPDSLMALKNFQDIEGLASKGYRR